MLIFFLYLFFSVPFRLPLAATWRRATVPWEAQAANNNPELLVWREEASCITTTVPGLYHLSLGFFTHSPVLSRSVLASHRIASHACVLAPIEE